MQANLGVASLRWDEMECARSNPKCSRSVHRWSSHTCCQVTGQSLARTPAFLLARQTTIYWICWTPEGFRRPLISAVWAGPDCPITTRCFALPAVESGSGERQKSSHIKTKTLRTHAGLSHVGSFLDLARGEEEEEEDGENQLTCCTGHTSRSGGLRSSGTRHTWCTAGRPPQEPEPPDRHR